MPERDDSVLDKAERVARKIFERLGARLDRKIEPQDQKALSHRSVGDLVARIEEAVEANLHRDKNGVRRVAPNLIKVLLTYEQASEVNDQYLQALAAELRSTTDEYINNRRYETRGPIQLGVRRDLFTKSTSVKAEFEPPIETESRSETSGQNRAGQAAAQKGPARRTLRLNIVGGREYQLELGIDEAPKLLGRAAGAALRIDDESVSRLHCSLVLRADGKLVVSDLGSANGTSVNGEAISPSDARTIEAGDIITIGEVELRIAGLD